MDESIGTAHLVAADGRQVFTLEPDIGLMKVRQILAVLKRGWLEHPGQQLVNPGNIVSKLAHAIAFLVLNLSFLLILTPWEKSSHVREQASPSASLEAQTLRTPILLHLKSQKGQ